MIKKNTTTQAIRTTSRAIIDGIIAKGIQSLRGLGKLVDRPKSNVHRHLQAQSRRNLHPESGLWETKSGGAWLRLLMFAVLYKFGLQHAVGADALSDFFKLIRIGTHVGISPSALRTQLSKMEALILTFQDSCEQSAPAQTRKAILAADETFFGELLILVLMDLSSGYLQLESIQDDRRFDTWFAQATPRLDALGIEVGHAVSDRAKALIKLAVEGFDCDSGADVFHEQYGLSRWLGSALGRRKVKADKHCDVAQKAVNKASVDEQAALEAQQVQAIEVRTQIDKAKQEYHENLLGITDDLHPFSLEDNTHNTVASITLKLEKRAEVLETIAVQLDIPDKHNALRKFRGQVGALASHVSFWWLWVDEILLDWSVDEATRQWLTGTLLPVGYWHYQLHKTKKPGQRKRYREAWQRAVKDFNADLPSMPAYLNVTSNAGWSGQNGWYGNSIVAHPLLKGVMAASPNCTITGED